MKNIVLTILVLILFAAFKSDENKSLRFVCWGLVSIQNNNTVRYVTKSTPFLIRKDSIYYGDSGCNDFVGSYSLKNDSIVFSGTSSTKQGCAEISWIENRLFSKLFNGKAKYVISADTLLLYGRNSNMFKFYKRIDKSKCFCKFSEV